MKKFRFALATTAVAAFATFNTVRAEPTNVRPATGVTAAELASLDTELNTSPIHFSGPSIDVVADQSKFAQFTNDAGGATSSTFLIELAGFSGTNRFGIYDAADPTKKAEVFDGVNVPGNQSFIGFTTTGVVEVNGTAVASGFATTPNFGFYIDVFGASVAQGGDGVDTTLDYTLYSEDDLNPGSLAQALTYQGNNATHLQAPGRPEGEFKDSQFLIAFEDLKRDVAGNSDDDFNDLVVIVESITPVPAPAALLLGAMGLGMVGWVRKRVK